MADKDNQGMGFAGVIAIGVVLGYIGFELFALHSARERMEPAQVFAQWVRAQHAVSLCAADTPYRSDFERNINAVIRRSLRDLAQQQPELTPAQRDAALAAQRRRLEREVDALIAEQGCGGSDARRLLRLYEVRSRLNLR